MRKFNGIYVLSDPRSDEIRYIGQTSVGFRRCYQHFIDPAKDRCHAWVRGLLSRGILPDVDIVEEFETAEELNEAETFYISYFRSIGVDLFNQTDGGKGAIGYKHSLTTKRLLSSYRGEKHHLYGKKRDKSIVEKLSRSLSKAVICVNDGKIFSSGKEAAAFYDITRSGISIVCNGKHEQVNGLVFRFVNA